MTASGPATSATPRVGPGSHVIVVGGGIAGIAAGLRLAQAGVKITLLETRRKLGGRATSFKDPRSGQVIDNCQHVALGCCTNYLDLCDRLGVGSKIRWLREVYWAEDGGRVSVMRPGNLPAPGHFTWSFLTLSFLTIAEKLAVALAMQAAMRADRDAWRQRTFAQWLSAQRQPERVIRRFWSPVVISACNLDVDTVCAATALHVFQEGFLAHRDASMVGVSAVPLVELYDPAEQALAKAGGEIRLGCGVERLWDRGVLTTAGEELHADAVVCAVPPERACRMVSDEVRATDPRFERAGRITHSPILGVHVVFDRAVLPVHSAVLVEKPTQWVFRKDEEGRSVHAVISAADEWVALDEQEITRRVCADLFACFPEGRGAGVVSSRSVKEKLATFAPTPEVEALRPPTTGPSGIVLAGDYVRSGWPATMEGATRTGYLAAAALLGEPLEQAMRPPLKPGWTVRTLAPALARVRPLQSA